MTIESQFVLPLLEITLTRLINWIINTYEEWKFDREFEKKKKELIRLDPFIYENIDSDKKNK